MKILFYAAAMAFLIVLIACYKFIPILSRWNFKQNIRQVGPQKHYKKNGTPTMGGIIIIITILITTIIFAGSSKDCWLALFVTIGNGLIGFIDDIIKIIYKRSLGLKANQKLIGQIIMALALAFILNNYFERGTDLWLPVSGIYFDIGVFYYLLLFLVLIGTTNAVNLTDGLDGLASSTIGIASFVYTIIAVLFVKNELAIFCIIVTSVCLGFLIYNIHPAKIFMGDTGSLALGGALSIMAIITKTELLLIIIGGVFIIETLSVMIQIVAFKITGKRIFLMSPIHHHFELKGWTEKKIVQVFLFIGVLFGIISLGIIAVTK